MLYRTVSTDSQSRWDRQTELLYQYLVSDNDARKKLPAAFLSVHPVCTLTKINMSYQIWQTGVGRLLNK